MIKFSDFFHPVLFQDDITKVSEDIKTANNANSKIVSIVESKLLTINSDKSSYLVMGDNKARRKLLEDLKKNPVVLNSVPMKFSTVAKYLGDELSENLSKSVSATVKKRLGLASCAIYEIRAVVDDKRADAIASLPTAFLLWEMAVVPMLTHNCEVWIDMSKKTLKELDKVQHKFLRVALAVGTGCPIPKLYTETGTMLMSNRVLLRKMLFLHHVATLPPSTLARQVYDWECQHTDYPCLVTECQTLLTEFGITDIREFTKYQWKKKMKYHFNLRNKNQLIEMSRKYKKINSDELSKEDFKMKPYFRSLNIQQARLQFKINSKMTPKVASNFHRDQKYRAIDYLCVGCSVARGSQEASVGGAGKGEGGGSKLNKSIDCEDHIIRCLSYLDLRQNLDLDVQSDMLKYFQLVIDRRTQEETKTYEVK